MYLTLVKLVNSSILHLALRKLVMQQPLSNVILVSHPMCTYATLVSLVVSSHLSIKVTHHYHNIVSVTYIYCLLQFFIEVVSLFLLPRVVWHVDLDHSQHPEPGIESSCYDPFAHLGPLHESYLCLFAYHNGHSTFMHLFITNVQRCHCPDVILCPLTLIHLH